MCALDAGLTLIFQPAAYWAGQFEKVNEFSPLDRWMLMQHPLAFVAGVSVWITGISLVLLWLPTRASLALAVTLVLGNATGASWWIGARLPGGFWIGYGLFLVIAVLVVATWVQAGVLTPANKSAEQVAPAERRR
ncbi:MAG TPA: hypothetical protein VG013_09070 [Gemmataceae bacterium]|nr:hypothetical protein [Gemmataceae bacterium]